MIDRINVLYTCDNAYLSMTSISMASVIENNKESFITFYLATESEDNENFRRLKNFYADNNNVDIRYLDCKMYDDLLNRKGLDKWGSNSYYVYWKLFAYDALDCDDIWYLDSDVICLNPIEYPKINKPVGACLDSAHACFNKNAHIPENYYFFNTGSLYVDVKKWKKNRCVDKVCEYIRNMVYQPLMCDQDILAISLQEEIEVINPKFDFLVGYDYYGVHNSFEMYSLDKKPFYTEKEIVDAKNDIVFYHCLGGVFGRPWEENNESPIRKDYERYREVSAWPEFSKPRNTSLLFKIEKFLEFLPNSLYNRVHNFAIRKHIEGLRKK